MTHGYNILYQIQLVKSKELLVVLHLDSWTVLNGSQLLDNFFDMCSPFEMRIYMYTQIFCHSFSSYFYVSDIVNYVYSVIRWLIYYSERKGYKVGLNETDSQESTF